MSQNLMTPAECLALVEKNAAAITKAMEDGDHAEARRCLGRAKRFALMAVRIEAGQFDNLEIEE